MAIFVTIGELGGISQNSQGSQNSQIYNNDTLINIEQIVSIGDYSKNTPYTIISMSNNDRIDVVMATNNVLRLLEEKLRAS